MRNLKALIFLMGILGSSYAATEVMINGAGATFPYPIYSKWFHEYKKQNPNVTINYNSIGSGAGIKQFTDKTIDFGASDAPMTDEQLKNANRSVLHIPTVLGAVVLTYNLAELKAPLRVTPDVLSAIYRGEIKKWNDPKLAAVNPGVTLPAKEILVTYRSDGSGTTAIFTDYLSKVSPEWKEKVGSGTAVKWPVGVGGKGNEGVTGLVKQTPGAIGYVELVYALQNKLSTAQLQNQSKQFVEANTKTVTAAAAGALKTIPADFRVSITNAAGKGAYPIAGFTYLLVDEEMKNAKGKELVSFLKWALGSKGQKMAEESAYSPLPSVLSAKVKKKVDSIQTQ